MKSKGVTRYWLLVTGVALAGQVWAGEVEDVVGQLSVEQADKAQAVLAQQARGVGCRDFQLVEIDGVTVLGIPKDKAGKMGKWMTRYLANACGAPWKGNVLFEEVAGGFKLSPLVPGETRTDPQLQADVMKSFSIAAVRAVPECAELPRIKLTQVSKAPKVALGAWEEVWIGMMCGREVGQVVMFMPNDKGVGFTMALKNN